MPHEHALDNAPAYVAVLAERLNNVQSLLSETRGKLDHLQSTSIDKEDFQRMWDAIEAFGERIDTAGEAPSKAVQADVEDLRKSFDDAKKELRRDFDATKRDHEARLRDLEQARWRYAGWAAGVAFIVALLWQIGSALMGKKG